MRMETVEHFAKIALVARTLGTPQELPADDVRKSEAIRERMKLMSPSNGHPPRMEAVGTIGDNASLIAFRSTIKPAAARSAAVDLSRPKAIRGVRLRCWPPR